MPELNRKTIEALNKISYGIYIITSRRDGKVNGQCANAVFQVTSSPRRVAIGINKRNYTHEFIKESGVFAINILGQDQIHVAKHFGLQCGRDVEKFANIKFQTKKTGSPILPGALAYLDCKVIPSLTVDVGTHTIFVADVLEGDVLKEGEPLTYGFYRKNR